MLQYCKIYLARDVRRHECRGTARFILQWAGGSMNACPERRDRADRNAASFSRLDSETARRVAWEARQVLVSLLLIGFHLFGKRVVSHHFQLSQ